MKNKFILYCTVGILAVATSTGIYGQPPQDNMTLDYIVSNTTDYTLSLEEKEASDSAISAPSTLPAQGSVQVTIQIPPCAYNPCSSGSFRYQYDDQNYCKISYYIADSQTPSYVPVVTVVGNEIGCRVDGAGNPTILSYQISIYNK